MAALHKILFLLNSATTWQSSANRAEEHLFVCLFCLNDTSGDAAENSPPKKHRNEKNVQVPVCASLPNTFHCSGSCTRPKLKCRGDDSASAAYLRLRWAALQTKEAVLTYCFCLLCTQPTPIPILQVFPSGAQAASATCPSPAAAPGLYF